MNRKMLTRWTNEALTAALNQNERVILEQAAPFRRGDSYDFFYANRETLRFLYVKTDEQLLIIDEMESRALETRNRGLIDEISESADRVLYPRG